MAGKVLTIEAGNSITRVCEVSCKRRKVRIYRSIAFPTPEKSVEDGFIINIPSYSKELLSQLHTGKFKSRKVIFTLSSGRIANREITIPPVRKNRIMDILRTGASEYFPIELSDYILSYDILSKKTSLRSDRKLRRRMASLRKHRERKETKVYLNLTKKLNRMNSQLSKQIDKNNKRGKRKNRRVRRKSELLLSASRQYTIEDLKPGYSYLEIMDSIQREYSYDDMEEQKKHLRLAIYAVPATLVDNYYELASKLKLSIVSLDYYGNSSYQLINKQASFGTKVFLQLNERDTMISIIKNNVLILQRTIAYGAYNLADAVMEEQYFHVDTRERALELLKTRKLLSLEMDDQVYLKESEAGLSAETAFGWSGKETAASGELSSIREAVDATVADEANRFAASKAYTNGNVRSAMDRKPMKEEEERARMGIITNLHFLTDSVSRMLDYYKSNHKNENIETIYLCGFGSKIKGIEDFFQSRIGISVNKVEKFTYVKAGRKASEFRANPGDFITCIGASIKPINFVPIRLTLRKQRHSEATRTVAMMLLCLAGSFLLYYVSHENYLAARKDLEDTREKLEALPSIGTLNEDYRRLEEELADLDSMVDRMGSNTSLIHTVIEELEKKLPAGTVIHTLYFTDSGFHMNVSILDISGRPYTITAKLLMQLQAIECIDEVDISDIAVEEATAETRVSFTISCTYNDLAE